jgi:hypothetical protein
VSACHVLIRVAVFVAYLGLLAWALDLYPWQRRR